MSPFVGEAEVAPDEVERLRSEESSSEISAQERLRPAKEGRVVAEVEGGQVSVAEDVDGIGGDCAKGPVVRWHGLRGTATRMSWLMWKPLGKRGRLGSAGLLAEGSSRMPAGFAPSRWMGVGCARRAGAS